MSNHRFIDNFKQTIDRTVSVIRYIADSFKPAKRKYLEERGFYRDYNKNWICKRIGASDLYSYISINSEFYRRASLAEIRNYVEEWEKLYGSKKSRKGG